MRFVFPGMLVVAVCAGSAMAVPLQIGTIISGTIGTDGTATATPSDPTDPQFAGTKLFESRQLYNVNNSGIVASGDVHEWVIREQSTGTLDFYFQVEPTVGGFSDGLTVTGMGTDTLDVGYFATGANSPSQLVFDRPPPLPHITNFVDIQSPNLDAIVYFRTDSKQFTATGGNVNIAFSIPHVGVAANVVGPLAGSTEAPPNPGTGGDGGGGIGGGSSPVPEPMSLMLLPLALAGLGIRTRRR